MLRAGARIMMLLLTGHRRQRSVLHYCDAVASINKIIVFFLLKRLDKLILLHYNNNRKRGKEK